MVEFSLKNKFIFVSLIIFVIVLSILLLTIFILFIFFSFSSSVEKNVHETHDYQLTEISLSSPRKIGIVSMPTDLPHENYLNYFNENTGSSFLISNFGGDNYECTGNCICQDSRRSSGTIISRGIVMLIAAFSTTMATKMTEEAMRQQCEHHFSDSCPEGQVLSEVESCEEKKEEEEEEEFDIVSDMEKKKGMNKEGYFCKGHCQTRKEVNDFNPILDEVEFFRNVYEEWGQKKVGNCKDLKIEKRFEPYTFYDSKNGGEKIARRYFVFKYLAPFCKEKSRFRKSWFSEKWLKQYEQQSRKIGYGLAIEHMQYCFAHPSIRITTQVITEYLMSAKCVKF